MLGPSRRARLKRGTVQMVSWLLYPNQKNPKITGVRVRGVVSKKKKKKIGLQGACLLALGSLEKTHARRDVETELRPGVPRMGL